MEQNNLVGYEKLKRSQGFTSGPPLSGTGSLIIFAAEGGEKI